jgi:hypothetical protein
MMGSYCEYMEPYCADNVSEDPLNLFLGEKNQGIGATIRRFE